MDYHWESCFKGYDQQNKVRAQADKHSQHFLHKAYLSLFFKQMINDTVPRFSVPSLSPVDGDLPNTFHVPPIPLPHCQHHRLYNSSRASASEGPQVLKECPDQNFQVSMLLSHLLASPAYTSDVLMQPYLSSWDELMK